MPSLRPAVPWLLMTALMGLLILLARDGIVFALVAVAVACFILFVAWAGAERAGRYLVVGGLFAAPMSGLVMPMATWVTVADLLFGLGFGLLLPGIIVSRDALQLPLLYTSGILIALLMGTIASLDAVHVTASFSMFVRYIVGVVLVPLAFMVWRPPVRVIGHLAMAYPLGVVISIGFGVIKNGERPGGRFIGMTEHPNVLGITGMIGIALIPFIWSRIRREHQWFWALVFAANGAAVWFSGSRAALVATMVIVLIWPVIERSVRGGMWIVLAGTCGLFIADSFLSASGGSAIGRLLGGGSAVASDAAREQLLQHYWAEFLSKPVLGSGFEEAVLGHNVYLQIAYAMGIFGAFSFILVLLAGALPLITSPRPLHRIAYPVIAYAMVAYLTSVIWDRYIWAPLALAFAIAVIDRGTAEKELDESLEPNLLTPASAGHRGVNG